VFVEHRINVYLRFGHPVRELRLNRWRRYAVITPAGKQKWGLPSNLWVTPACWKLSISR